MRERDDDDDEDDFGERRRDRFGEVFGEDASSREEEAKKGEDKENVNDYSNGVVMGASNDDVDAKSATELQFKRDFFQKQWRKDARIYEYGSAANPDMKPIPVLVHPPDWHERGETRVIPFDIDDFLKSISSARRQT